MWPRQLGKPLASPFRSICTSDDMLAPSLDLSASQCRTFPSFSAFRGLKFSCSVLSTPWAACIWHTKEKKNWGHIYCFLHSYNLPMSLARSSVHATMQEAHATTVTPTGSRITEPDCLCGNCGSHAMKLSFTFKTPVLGIFKVIFLFHWHRFYIYCYKRHGSSIVR